MKATCFWQDDISLYKYLTLYSLEKGAKWKNIEFTTGDNYDFTIVFTAPFINHNLRDPNSAILFRTEPPSSSHYNRKLDLRTSKMYCPEIFWGLSQQRIAEVRNGKFLKRGCLSSVTSEASFMEGHEKRLMFIYYLDKVIEKGFTLYGRKYSGEFFKNIKAYRGEIPDKLIGLKKFFYTFSCENSFEADYFTEKILQPIITKTLCFYDGCNNIFEYLNPEALVKIDITDIGQSIEKIQKCIHDEHYIKINETLEKERERVLDKFNMLNIIWAEVNEFDTDRFFKI